MAGELYRRRCSSHSSRVGSSLSTTTQARSGVGWVEREALCFVSKGLPVLVENRAPIAVARAVDPPDGRASHFARCAYVRRRFGRGEKPNGLVAVAPRVGERQAHAVEQTELDATNTLEHRARRGVVERREHGVDRDVRGGVDGREAVDGRAVSSLKEAKVIVDARDAFDVELAAREALSPRIAAYRALAWATCTVGAPSRSRSTTTRSRAAVDPEPNARTIERSGEQHARLEVELVLLVLSSLVELPRAAFARGQQQRRDRVGLAVDERDRVGVVLDHRDSLGGHHHARAGSRVRGAGRLRGVLRRGTSTECASERGRSARGSARLR